LIAEAQTFIYAARALSRNRGHIYRIKNGVPLAALPSYWTPRATGSARQRIPPIHRREQRPRSRVALPQLRFAGGRPLGGDTQYRELQGHHGAFLDRASLHFRGRPYEPCAYRHPCSTLSAPTPTIDIIIELGSILHGNGGKDE